MRLELPTYNAFIDAIWILSNTKQKLNDVVDANFRLNDGKPNRDDIDNQFVSDYQLLGLNIELSNFVVWMSS